MTYENPPVTLMTDICSLQFDIENDLTPPILMYYRLSNFFQNHRRYVKSFDQSQLNGDARTSSQITSGDCSPLATDENANGRPYYPCGLIANSIFNDTLHQPLALNPAGGGNATNYTMTNKGIAWSSDKDLYKQTKYQTGDVVPPPNWRRKYGSEYNSSYALPDLHNDEAFQVWMRTAGLPTFSKLALRQDDKSQIMSRGRYQVDIWAGAFSPSNTNHKRDYANDGSQNSMSLDTAEPRKCSSRHVLSWAARTLSWVSRILSSVDFAFFWVLYSLRHISSNRESWVTTPIFRGTTRRLVPQQRRGEVCDRVSRMPKVGFCVNSDGCFMF